MLCFCHCYHYHQHHCHHHHHHHHCQCKTEKISRVTVVTFDEVGQVNVGLAFARFNVMTELDFIEYLFNLRHTVTVHFRLSPHTVGLSPHTVAVSCPSPPTDNILAVITVCRIRGKITRAALKVTRRCKFSLQSCCNITYLTVCSSAAVGRHKHVAGRMMTITLYCK